MSDEELAALLTSVNTIAVVGISDRSDRPSYGVAKYLQRYFRVVPVNPHLANWEGLACYPSVGDIPNGDEVDLVNIFRRPIDVPPIVDAAILRGVRAIWMQLGIKHADAAQRAVNAGIAVVMDRCIAVEYRRLLRSNS